MQNVLGMTYKGELIKWARKQLASKKMPITRKRVLVKRLAFTVMVKHKNDGIAVKCASPTN